MQVTEPTMLLDEQTVRRNIEVMAQKASDHNLEFKPHFKTHQSKKVGQWFRKTGVESITVSSVKMAEYFADDWKDITIAFPFNPHMTERVNLLAEQVSISILLSDINTLGFITPNIETDINVFIEIDTGSDRTGFLPSQKGDIKQLALEIKSAQHLHFKGLYSHPGHSYNCRSKSKIRAVHQDALNKMQSLKKILLPDFPEMITCIGDTPCCSAAENFEGINAISPGNFVFYDLMQSQIGSCRIDEIGVALACPVVATYPKRNEIVVHGGAVHLSKDLLDQPDIKFGKIVPVSDDLSWGEPIHNCYVKSLSQEHGIVKCNTSLMHNISIGDTLGILPVHSCLTANIMKRYILTETGEAIDHMEGQ